MASSRLSQASYEAAKKVAEFKKVSAVSYISEIVLRESLADMAEIVDRLKASSVDEVESLMATRRSQIAELEQYLKPND